MSRLAREIEFREGELSNALDKARAKFQHSGNKGAVLETAFRHVLSEVMPRKYEIGHGEIVDYLGNHAGSTSQDGQIDVIILDGEQLQFQSIMEPGLYIADNALMIGEVKASLNHKELDSAWRRAAEVKALKPCYEEHDEVFGNPDVIANFMEKRGYFLFCYESKLEMLKVLSWIKAKEIEAGNFAPIDAIFCLKSFVLLNNRNCNGQYKVCLADGSFPPGMVALETKNALAELIMWLHANTPRVNRRTSSLHHHLRS